MKQTIKINKRPEEQGWKHTTELCMDVKTYLRGEIRMRTGKNYQGVLTRDSEEHMTFMETSCQKKMKRNPHIYEGERITVTRRDDGTYRLNFCPIPIGAGFSLETYALGVYNEICMALGGLIEEV